MRDKIATKIIIVEWLNNLAFSLIMCLFEFEYFIHKGQCPKAERSVRGGAKVQINFSVPSVIRVAVNPAYHCWRLSPDKRHVALPLEGTTGASPMRGQERVGVQAATKYPFARMRDHNVSQVTIQKGQKVGPTP